eukprot:scaffold29269_cov36-Tisochrysis_lutea.AAC.2
MEIGADGYKSNKRLEYPLADEYTLDGSTPLDKHRGRTPKESPPENKSQTPTPHGAAINIVVHE